MHFVKLFIGATLTFATAAALAQATPPACASGETEIQNTNALLTNSYICAARAPDTWQEFHRADGALFDWKLGPNNTTDPTKQVGTWSSGTGTVTHIYGANSYSWRVCRTSTGQNPQYTLRSSTGGIITGATVVGGTVTQTNRPCP